MGEVPQVCQEEFIWAISPKTALKPESAPRK